MNAFDIKKLGLQFHSIFTRSPLLCLLSLMLHVVTRMLVATDPARAEVVVCATMLEPTVATNILDDACSRSRWCHVLPTAANAPTVQQ